MLCFWFLPTANSGIDSATLALFNFKYAPAGVTNWRTVFDFGKFLCDIGSVGGSVATSYVESAGNVEKKNKQTNKEMENELIFRKLNWHQRKIS